MDWNLINVVLWAVGILIAVLLAFLGVKRVTRKKSQTANAKANSTIIQSGRDTRLK